MPVLDAQNLSKSLGTRTLLQGMNLTIARGEKIGLVGNNGAGKSTLARILAGKLDADAGVVNYRRGARVAYLDQDPRFEPQLSAREAALVSLTEWRAAKLRYDELCEQLARGGLAEESPAWKAP
ncbi:MAG TPA: ATP-binding cassette domain-containing protein, partial [Polyangiaceae bacterium]|nr:ATP-binding cassette domain-containing protein [Polyangiaceae bacterium]